MGIFNALFSGVNGINSNGDAISVVGDNISNVNTVGYKGSRASFEDILAGSGSNIGLGSRISGVTPQFSQGGFESTSSVTDMAVDGEGFFQLSTPADGSLVYTRAGQFTVDKDGFLVNNDGLRVQGFQVDDSGNTTSSIDDIVVSSEPVAPEPTTEVAFRMNLDSNETAPGAFSTGDPTGTSNFSAGVTVFDSLGNSHLVSVYFRKSGANAWQWFALVDGSEITAGSAGVATQCANGSLAFATDGTLTSVTTTASDFDFLGAVQSQTITFDFGTATSAGGTGLDGATQFGSDSAINSITQDGFAQGSLKNIEVSADGTITGNYTNGTSTTIAQVVLATFSNKEALARIGSNNYRETLASGTAVLGSAGGAGKGNLVSNTLEQSNVDLAGELIRMVIIQRGFQANSRTISTVSEMLAQLVTVGQ